MFKGSFSAFLFFQVGATAALLSLVIIYWQSQFYHQQPPFPHQYISIVAQHYPQFVVFRLSTVTGAALIILGWFTNHFVLRSICLEEGIDFKKYHPQIVLVVGTVGGLLLMGNTASIDTGIMNKKLHVFCASKFFIVTFIAQIYNTVICSYLSNQTKSISKTNLYVKYGILAFLALQGINGAMKGYGLYDDSNSDKSKFLEWTLTATIISMFISIGMDGKPFQFVYTDVSKQYQGEEREETQPYMIS